MKKTVADVFLWHTVCHRWLPFHGPHTAAVWRSSLQYIEAADNYVNIHYVNAGKEETFILLNSMKNIEKAQ